MNKILEFFKNIKFPKAPDFFRKIKFPKIKFKRPTWGLLITWVVALGLGIGLFVIVKNLAMCWTVTNLPGVPPASCKLNVNPLGTLVLNAEGTAVAPVDLPTPVIEAPEAQLAQWDGASRVNILFIGLDYRDYIANEGPPRSDTMILFTIDPLSKTAGILSIPRDLWVNIPGFGYSRINTAYASGEGNKLPGGGPGLAAKTIEQVIGVPVNYFGQIDFHSFEEVIDTMGGLYICIPQKIRIDPIGDKKPRNLKPGCQTLWGYEVLAYARNRYTADGDVDRSKRQQLVIMALRDQIFSPQNFPNMVALAPKIYQEASAGIRTNMTFEEAMRLATLLNQIPPESIKRGVIDNSMVLPDNTTLAGQDAAVLKPIPDKIRMLRDEIFSTTGPLSPLAQGDPVTLMKADAARVRVFNGTYTAGLDSRTGNYLVSQGMNVVEVGQAPQLYGRTTIMVYSPKLYTLKYLAAVFGVTAYDQIIFKAEPSSPVDIEVRLGDDWISMIPAGF
jgi:polyisoprenyl-teichoic acid--peptidoglycan teichoic acid transferase